MDIILTINSPIMLLVIVVGRTSLSNRLTFMISLIRGAWGHSGWIILKGNFELI